VVIVRDFSVIEVGLDVPASQVCAVAGGADPGELSLLPMHRGQRPRYNRNFGPNHGGQRSGRPTRASRNEPLKPLAALTAGYIDSLRAQWLLVLVT